MKKTKREKTPAAIAEDANFGVDLIYSARSSLGIDSGDGLGSNVLSLHVGVVGNVSSDVSVSLGKVDVFVIKVSNVLSNSNLFSS